MGNELQVMRLNIAICDDEKAIREQIKELIEKEKAGICPDLYETGDALLAADKKFDIVFLDIQMEGTDGIETAKKLRERSALKGAEDTILLFITGIREYVFQAFDVAAFHYLLKPVEEDKFYEVFHRAERELEKDSILYIESRGKKVEIHTKGETIEAYDSMNELEAQLGEGFFRCYRGYLVNMAYVAEYDSESITLNDRWAAILKIMEDLKNECKWNRGSRISGMAGSKKSTAEYDRKELCRVGKQCGEYT